MTAARAWSRPVLVALAAAALVSALGSTITELGPWYRSLRQPDWAPPDVAFPIAWTTVYAFTVAAGVLAWRAAPDMGARERVIGLFGLNIFLNILWSLIFFRLHRPDWALAEVIFFWLSILALIIVAARHSRGARWLLLPYAIWVAFAAWLNLDIVRLNGPFA